jgi:hypothetical protein
MAGLRLTAKKQHATSKPEVAGSGRPGAPGAFATTDLFIADYGP